MRAFEQVTERGLGDEGAVAEHPNPVRDRLSFTEDVCAQQNSGALGSTLTHDVQDQFLHARIKSGGGFVEDKHLRIGEEG